MATSETWLLVYRLTVEGKRPHPALLAGIDDFLVFRFVGKDVGGRACFSCACWWRDLDALAVEDCADLFFQISLFTILLSHISYDTGSGPCQPSLIRMRHCFLVIIAQLRDITVGIAVPAAASSKSQ